MISLKLTGKLEFDNEFKELMEQEKSKLSKIIKKDDTYSDSLGWLDVEEWANEGRLARIEKLAAGIRADAEAFVLVGVGGSNNAARAVIEALSDGKNPKIIYAGNTLSPHALKKVMKEIDGKSVYINCIAKNFETLEPGASFRILRQYLYKHYGEKAKERIFVTGTSGSNLEKLCMKYGYEFLDFPVNIGGRYTAISNVGLLPMAVAGIDIRELAKGAGEMQKSLFELEYQDNIAYKYACLRNFLYKRGYGIEILSSFEPQYRYFYKWWIQLFAESEGKDMKGIFPVASEYSEELHSVGQFVQDGSGIIFETFLDVQDVEDSLIIMPDPIEDGFAYLNGKDFKEINKSAFEATVSAHSEKLPCTVISVERIDAHSFGELFYFFQFACYLSCEIMGVNAFNQPGVEAYKKYMFDKLKRDVL